MDHCFILTTKEDVPLALDYYMNCKANNKKNIRKICFVPDSFVLQHKELFMDIEVFVQNFDKKGNKLDYYGKTIIPPESVALIKNKFDTKASLILKSKYNPKIRKFYKLLQNSINSQEYVVHLGI